MPASKGDDGDAEGIASSISFGLVKEWAWKSADCFRAQVGGHKNRCAREIYVFREALVAVIEKKAHTRAHPGMTE